MNRRGFFSRLGSAFERHHEGDPFFFGVQAVINVYGEDTLRARLHHILADGSASEKPEDKHAFYKRITAVLRESIPFFEYGYWDYITDADAASEEFSSWVGELEAETATEEEEIGTEIDESFRLSNDKSYVVVTMVFLLEYTGALSEMMRMVDSISEEQYFTPYGFQRLIDTVNYIDFEYSLGDAVFIMPGNENDGFSWTDMRGEGWEYLKPIMGTIN